MTNRDRYRQLSDRHIALILAEARKDCECCEFEDVCEGTFFACVDHMEKWLGSEVKTNGVEH